MKVLKGISIQLKFVCNNSHSSSSQCCTLLLSSHRTRNHVALETTERSKLCTKLKRVKERSTVLIQSPSFNFGIRAISTPYSTVVPRVLSIYCPNSKSNLGRQRTKMRIQDFYSCRASYSLFLLKQALP